jgi:hypothetical protein
MPPATASVETGPIPFERHKEILENARRKAREEAEGEWQPYAWAKQVPRDQLQRMAAWYQSAIRDPYSLYERLTQELSAHPEYGAKVRSYAARLLRQSRQATVEDEMPQPDIPVMNEQGQVVARTYSDKQLEKREAYLRQQSEQSIAERLRPLEQRQARAEAKERELAARQQANQYAADTLKELRQNEHFKAHEPKVKAALLAHPDWDVYRAFNHVLATDVLPGLSQAEQAKTLATLQQKAAAGTVGPRGAVTTDRPKFKDFAEAMRYMETHPEEAAALAER